MIKLTSRDGEVFRSLRIFGCRDKTYIQMYNAQKLEWAQRYVDLVVGSTSSKLSDPVKALPCSSKMLKNVEGNHWYLNCICGEKYVGQICHYKPYAKQITN